MSFEEWLKQVDAILVSEIGMGVNDLSDKCWRDEYDAGSEPLEAIGELVGDLDDIDGVMMEEFFG